MVIVDINQLDQLIRLAVELGEGLVNLSDEQMVALREYVAAFTPEQHAKFMMCEYVIACCATDVGLLPASEEQKNIMALQLTGQKAA